MPKLLYFDEEQKNLCYFTLDGEKDLLKLHSIDKTGLDDKSNHEGELSSTDLFVFRDKLKKLVELTLGISKGSITPLM